MNPPIASLLVRSERDVVLARRRARDIAAVVGFDRQDQTRISTAVSEIARNAYNYARGGVVEFRIEGRTSPQVFVTRISDQGLGIANLAEILEGDYRSTTGMGLGLVGARRLMDQFEVQSDPQHGTTVVLKKLLPRRAPVVDTAALQRIARVLEQPAAGDPLDEVQRQNQELMRALDELERQQQELVAVNRELEDTNRGVVALYAELDEKADHLRRADELKTRFLSNMSHEFRTPVNSILALARILLDELDGELTSEQQRQVNFIAKAAESLAELVSDLLDLAKVEAGKITVRPIDFEIEHLFGALRGMLRPLLVNDGVSLVFEEPDGVSHIYSDEAKVSQIIRNFVSNALKFTERGEIRVSARAADGGRLVVFSVADTGIGIAPEDHERIFHEFTQIDSVLQRKVQGTGLGLPLCRKLAEILGGSVGVQSTPGQGSRFEASIPVRYSEPIPAKPDWKPDARRVPILIVEDAAEMTLIYDKMLSDTEYQPLFARNTREAREALAAFRPKAIVLDILLRGEDSWPLLTELKARNETRDIPVAVISDVDDESKMLALGADAACVKPIDRSRLLEILGRLVAPEAVRRILLIDDEEISRYVLRQHLWRPNLIVTEESTGLGGLKRAQRESPDVIFLDLGLPDLGGAEVLAELRATSETSHIPVVIVSGAELDAEARESLRAHGTQVLAKSELSRERAQDALARALLGRSHDRRP